MPPSISTRSGTPRPGRRSPPTTSLCCFRRGRLQRCALPHFGTRPRFDFAFLGSAFVPSCQLGRRKQHIPGCSYETPGSTHPSLVLLQPHLELAPPRHIYGNATQTIFWFELAMVPIRVETRRWQRSRGFQVSSFPPTVPRRHWCPVNRTLKSSVSLEPQDVIDVISRRLVFDGATSLTSSTLP